MNRRFMPILVFLVIYFLPCLGWSADNPQASNNSAGEVTERMIECLQADDFDCAVKIFHYPQSYNQNDLYDDITGIKSSLQIFRNEFGAIRQVKLRKAPAQYYTVSVESANLNYWQRHPYSLKTEFTVVFDNAGEGFISVQACKINSYWEIRNVSYGLSVDSPDSRNKITEVTRKVVRVMENMNKAREKKLLDKGHAPKTF